MQRNQILDAIRSEKIWDMVVIGGGATGLGTALDAALRGYRTLLLESHDFAKGTSSRSTKLIHGGVRYLAQGRVGLVRQALRERQILRENAPELVHDRAFLIPAYSRWDKPYYGFGLKAYDVLAGRSRWEWSHGIGREEALALAPTLAREGLRGGIVYRDGQFDDARLAIAILATFLDQGGVAANAMGVEGIIHESNRVRGVVARDGETQERFEIFARSVVNATGVFADSVRSLDDPAAVRMIAPSQGVHLVFDAAFLPGETAILIPKTPDGRVLFAIPWLGKVVVGTTDTPVETISVEPRPLPAEVEFLLDQTHKYLGKRPDADDVRSVYVGLRPLIGGPGSKTASLSRGHAVIVSKTGLTTITGGKWTTYRVMARDAVDRAAEFAGLPARACRTDGFRLHADVNERRAAILAENPAWDAPIHPSLPYTRADVIVAARHELARSVEDVLSRRTRSLLLDARAAIESAGQVASLLAGELGFGEAWEEEQVKMFGELGRTYLID